MKPAVSLSAAARSVLAAACPALVPSCGGDAAPPPPSVILVSLDTLRGDHTTFLGYGRDTTPHLEALAAEGVIFERAFSTSCWTLTSHVGMLTGLYPEQHGVVSNNAALNPKIPLLAERLRERGYLTTALYEFGWIHERHGFDRGFDVFRPHRDAEQAEEHLAQELDRFDGERPFFLFLHLFDIHCDPLLKEDGVFYDPPPPYDRRYRSDAPDAIRGLDFKRALQEPGLLDADQLDALVAMYDGGIRYTDAKVGSWLEDWRERGLLDRAVLIVTSDHGEALGQRAGDLDNHGGMYQEGLRIPLLVRFPDGRMAGESRAHAVNSVDIVPTVLELAGLEPDPAAAGLPALRRAPGGLGHGGHAGRRLRAAAVALEDQGLGRRGGALPARARPRRDPADLDPVARGRRRLPGACARTSIASASASSPSTPPPARRRS